MSTLCRVTSTPPAPVPFPPVPADVPGLLKALLADPGRPRVTWYGPDAERVELSAKVLDNWVAKSANLLVDELDAGPGSAVLVDLPGHWRTVCWLLAIWATGATAVLPDAAVPQPDVPALPLAAHPDAVVTTRPRHWAGRSTGPFAGTTLLAVALPALATRFAGPLPDGAVDAATEIRGHGDVFLPAVRPAAADPALISADGAVVTHGELLPAAARAASAAALPGGVRLLTGSGPDRVLDGWLPALVAGGSLVLHHDLAALDATTRDRLVTQEGIQVVALGQVGQPASVIAPVPTPPARSSR